MATLNNKEFMQILKNACKDGKIDDEYLNEVLGAYYPYNLTFKGGTEECEKCGTEYRLLPMERKTDESE